MRNNVKAYKVLRTNFDGKLLSVSTLERDCYVIYKCNRLNRPKIKNSKLFIFETIEDARSYYGGGIWEVEANNVTEAKEMSNYAFEDGFEDYWNNKSKNKNIQMPPKGTMYCSSLRLVKKVS